MARGTIVSVTQVQPIPDFCGDIYRLIRPANSEARLIDGVLAEVNVGARTRLHHHIEGEEFYFVIEGIGNMHLGNDSQEVSAGSVIHIPAELPHMIENIGSTTLRLFVVNAPPYERQNIVFDEDALQ